MIERFQSYICFPPYSSIFNIISLLLSVYLGIIPLSYAQPYVYPDTSSCPYKISTPEAVDTSEVPTSGTPPLAPLPVPQTPIGGPQLGRCSVIVPATSPAVPQNITSSSWLLADYTTGEVLAAKDPHGRYRPASTIKLLLAYTVARILPMNFQIQGIRSEETIEGDQVGIWHDGTYTIRQLLEGLLLVSGNDAAETLARALGGRDKALQLMNKNAYQLQAYDTRATSPSGLDAPGMSSSVYDLALILKAALTIPVLREIFQIQKSYFPGHGSAPGYPIFSENRYVKQLGNIGGKTGYTDDAKKTYVGAVERNGRKLIVVQMYGLSYPHNSYWDQSDALLSWGAHLNPHLSIGRLVTPLLFHKTRITPTRDFNFNHQIHNKSSIEVTLVIIGIAITMISGFWYAYKDVAWDKAQKPGT